MGDDTSLVTDLLDRWCTALGVAGSTAPVDDQRAAGLALLARWAEPHRRYHTTAHLAAVLSTVDELTAADAAGHDAVAVELATWFHDAVYDPLRGDNEDASATLAETVLTSLAVPAGVVTETARLVRVTAAHEPESDDRNGALLCDADLAILAAPPSVYQRYADAVREEYAHVDNATFRAGRAAVLQRLLARPSLFNLGAARDKWERQARINLAIELSALTTGGQSRKPHDP
jgi:predicted metal-dependent HD superfamily phosphohydrolase